MCQKNSSSAELLYILCWLQADTKLEISVCVGDTTYLYAREQNKKNLPIIRKNKKRLVCISGIRKVFYKICNIFMISKFHNIVRTEYANKNILIDKNED